MKDLEINHRMTNLEINHRLALAIGYPPEDVRVNQFNVEVWRGYELFKERLACWQKFNYRDADTIYPIAEHFKMMPSWFSPRGDWGVFMDSKWLHHTDPRTCIALAIIEAADRGIVEEVLGRGRTPNVFLARSVVEAIRSQKGTT